MKPRATNKVAPKTAKPVFEPRVYADHQRRTAILLKAEEGQATYIPLLIEGFELNTMSQQEFNRQFYLMEDYPVEKAAKLYAGYAADLGGSLEAMQALASITTLSAKEIEMATAKKAAAAAKTTATKTAAAKGKAAPAAKKATTAKPVPVKEAKGKPVPAAGKEAKAPKAAAEKKPSASQMFKDLIMAGKKTDDQIFAEVQKAFNLDDSKKSYVKWYRNDLTKKGMNPPAAK